jgi:hypothetical protein
LTPAGSDESERVKHDIKHYYVLIKIITFRGIFKEDHLPCLWWKTPQRNASRQRKVEKGWKKGQARTAGISSSAVVIS